jgi:hypothetical protein
MKIAARTRSAILMSLGAAAAVAVAPGPASAAVYGGSTSHHAPIAITTAKSGKLKKIAIDWIAPCTSDQSFPFGGVLVSAARMPTVIPPGINPLIGAIKKGKLTATALGSATLGEGMSAMIVQKARGTFKRTTASGTWSAHVNILDAEGNSVDSCDTGTIRWSATAGPTVYGGSTTQGEPVVIKTSKSRARIAYLGFGWGASCAPDGYAWFFEDLGNFPLTEGGAFGDTWTNDYPFSDGSGKNSYTYTIHGALKRGRGSGTLSIGVVATDSGGATTRTCNTNTVRWSVTQ